MKLTAIEIISLGLVVVTLVTTTLFLENNDVSQQAPVAKVATTAIVEPIEQFAYGNQKKQNYAEKLTTQNDQPQVKEPQSQVSAIAPINEPSGSIETISRDQTIDQLRTKFRLLETQYGDLSVKDIQLLEASIDDIDTNSLTALSYALDDLL